MDKDDLIEVAVQYAETLPDFLAPVKGGCCGGLAQRTKQGELLVVFNTMC